MLCAVGDLVEDVVVWLDAEPRRGTDTPALVHRVRGGSAANVAALAVAAGLPARFVGRVGDDRLGTELVAELTAAGVDVRVEVGGRTGTVIVLVHPDGERTMLPDRAAATELSPVPASVLAGIATLHLPAYSLVTQPLAGSALAAAHVVVAGGGEVTVDASSTSVLEAFGVDRFLAVVADLRPAVLFANRDEADLLRLLGGVETGADVVVIKRGPEPVIVLRPGMDALAVEVPPAGRCRDTTGAGDAFAAGFLAARAVGIDLGDAVVGASTFAGRVLRTAGAAV